jgi:hypothetical protein
MTDQQLAKAQDLKRIIATISGELDKCNGKNKPVQGINVFLPNVGTLIDDVGQVFSKHLEMYNKKFREL